MAKKYALQSNGLISPAGGPMSRRNRHPACKWFERSFSIVVVALILLVQVAPAQSEIATLELNHPIQRSIAAGEAQSYSLNLAQGQYAYVTVDQRGTDVVVSVFAPDGTKLV